MAPKRPLACGGHREILCLQREEIELMWVIANGAPKNGSTWITQILTATNRFRPVPDDLRRPGWKNSSVANHDVEEAVRRLASADAPYLTKQHWHAQESGDSPAISGILRHPGVRMLNITRDVRDMIVSRFHHATRLEKFRGTLSTFVFQNSADIIRGQAAYQKYWIEHPDMNTRNYWITTYEHLTAHHRAEADSLFEFVGVPITDEQRATSFERTQFAARHAVSSQFFRKGKVFGFQDELTEAEADYLLDIARDCGLVDVKRSIAAFRPVLAASLSQTDVGL
jgi:hypothetical protein